jgi:FMN-dependent NADH-azoreductase
MGYKEFTISSNLCHYILDHIRHPFHTFLIQREKQDILLKIKKIYVVLQRYFDQLDK